MNLILNEEEVLKKSLSEGFTNEKKPILIIKILIKYFFSKGMNKNQVRDSIESFMKDKFKGFNSVKWRVKLDQLVLKGQKEKYELIHIDNINIFKNELEIIKNINNKRLEKLLFVLLVYSKIYNKINNNKSNWVNSNSKYIFSDCKISASIKNQQLMLHKLKEMHLIDVSNKIDCTNIKLNFIDETGEIGLEISDFRNFVYEYLRWKGEKIGNCEVCNRLFIQNVNNKKYCNICAKDIEKENHKVRNRKYMQRKRSVDEAEKS